MMTYDELRWHGEEGGGRGMEWHREEGKGDVWHGEERGGRGMEWHREEGKEVCGMVKRGRKGDGVA